MTLDAAQTGKTEPIDPRFASVDCVFFVIGAQKAGTTWLSHYLKAHPEVSVPEWKEHDYWNMVEGRAHPSRMLREQKARRERGSVMRSLVAALPFTLHARRQRAITLALRAVEAPFPPFSAYADVILENRGASTRAAGEICPEYALLRSDTFGRMAGLSPNVRFIFLLRDPVSRFVSGVRHTLRKTLGKGQVTPAALSEALRAFASDNEARPYVLSDYQRTMTALQGTVPSDRILYVFFEEMFTQDQVRRICDFLGISFLPAKIHRQSNVAGSSAVAVRDEDRRDIARALRPVYQFALERFGGALPQKWLISAALAGALSERERA